jgi:hypothetical protein
MSKLGRCASLLAGLTLAACSGQSGTEGEETIPCVLLSTEAVSADAATPVGTPNEVVAQVAGAKQAPARWWSHAGGQTQNDTELTVEAVVEISSARFLTREAEDPAGDFSCPDLLEMDASLRFETADGTFDEVFVGTLSRSESSIEMRATLPAASLAGSYDDSALVGSYEDPVYTVRTSLDTPQGHLSLEGTDDDPSDNEVPVSAMIAEWPSG